MRGYRLLFFINILAAYLVIGAAYVLLTPDWQAPDEPAHYNYVRYLATQRAFPELVGGCYNQAYLEQLTASRFTQELSAASLCYEFHQPPLYYLLAAPVGALSRGSLIALRFVSLALGAGAVVLAFFTGQTIFPDRPAIALGTMAFVAFVPMHLAILASVNNDALAELILAVLLLLLSRRLLADGRPSTRSDGLLGLFLGLGLLSKVTVYIALPLAAATLWLRSNRTMRQAGSGRDWAGLARQAGLIYGLALVIALPWYIRNGALYGPLDILGLIRHDQVVVGQPRTADFVAEVGGLTYLRRFVTTTFHSFWGQFGWMAVPMDRRVYLVLSLLTLTAAGGLAAYWRSVIKNRQGASSLDNSSPELSPGQRQALGLMALTVVLMALAYGWYNLTFVQLQGRYLFPALIPLGLFFSMGLRQAFSRRWLWWLAAGLGVALGWVAAASLLRGRLDKWGLLITGLALAVVGGRALLARYWFVPPAWMLIGCYGLLGVLALVSPFWFVLPHLSP